MQENPGSGPMRQPGSAASPILAFNLAQEIEQLRHEEPWQTTGRNAQTMVKRSFKSIILLEGSRCRRLRSLDYVPDPLLCYFHLPSSANCAGLQDIAFEPAANTGCACKQL